jgi:hypothetical protein
LAREQAPPTLAMRPRVARPLPNNCTLKRSPEISNTSGLADLAVAIMQRNGVTVETIRAVDHQIATGVYPDMTEHGWDR